MNKQSILLIISAVLLMSAVGAGAYFIFQKFDNKEVATNTKPAVDIPLDTARSNPETIQTDLSVKSTQNLSNQQQTSLPSPDQFSVYEQYANEEGIRYIDTKVGTGKEATAGDTVAAIYKGWLTNGQLFDQSSVNEEGLKVAIPFTIGAGQVIQGWEIGFSGMKEGGKRRLIIPSNMAYGENGAADGVIPPNSMLIFDVELAQVQKASNN